MKKIREFGDKIHRNIRHPRQEHESRKLERQPSLTYSEFEREFRAQNEGRDSMENDRNPRPKWMLHGTTQQNADNISQTGLQTSYGGQGGGLSRDQQEREKSQGVVHGTTSTGGAKTYAQLAEGDNGAVVGFRNIYPQSTNADRGSNGSYTINRSIPRNQTVRIPPQEVATWRDDRLP